MAEVHNTTDTTSKPGADQLPPHPAAAAGDKMAADIYSKPGAEASTVKDSGAKVSDQGLEKVKASTETPAVDAFTHLTQAQQAANEIAKIVKADKKESDPITFKGADGKEHTETVDQRVKELKKIVDTECASAVNQSNNIKQSDVSALLQTARNERNTLATELKLDPDKLSRASIAEALHSTTDSGAAAKLEQLSQLQAKVDTYTMWSNAPAVTRMLYASFKASGLTDPDSGIHRTADGELKVSQKDIGDAVSLMAEAASNKDLRSSKLYVQAFSNVLNQVESTSASVQNLTKDMVGATQAGAKGDTKEQERLLKDAVALADQTNTAAIAQMIRDPRFAQSQRDPAVVDELAKSAVLASTARLQYAQFLMDQGKFADAQGLVLKVKTECPEVMYAADPKDPTKLDYNQSRFVDMNKLDHEAASSSNVQASQIRTLLEDFQSAMGKGQIESSGNVRGAKDLITDLYTAANKKVSEVADGQKGLQTAQQELDQKRTELAAKKYLSADSRALEQKQLDREQALIKQQQALLEADGKDANKLLNVVKLYNAGMDVAEDKRDAARQLLAEVKTGDPELAAPKDANGNASYFATLEDKSKEPGFWDSNWKKFAIGGAVLAGLAAGVATCYLGPGAVLAGVGTTTSLMAAIGAGSAVVGASTAGGALGYLGTHEAIHATGALTQNVDVGRDLLDGSRIGALVGTGVISAPLASAAFGMAPGAAFSAARLATVGKMAAVGFVASGNQQVFDYFSKPADQRSMSEALKNTAIGTATFAAMPFFPVVGQAVSKLPGATQVGRAVGSVFARGGAVAAVGADTMTGTLPAAVPDLIPAADLAPGALEETTSASAQAAKTEGQILAPQAAKGGIPLGQIGMGLLMPGADQATQGIQDRLMADQMGPAYFFDEDGKVGPVQDAGIFGPTHSTRGWNPDNPNEMAIILGNNQAIDPGVFQTDAMASYKPVAPVVSKQSDFTDADHPAGDVPPQPNQP